MWGYSQTKFAALRGGGSHEMSMLQNKFGKLFLVKMSTKGGGIKKAKNIRGRSQLPYRFFIGK